MRIIFSNKVIANNANGIKIMRIIFSNKVIANNANGIKIMRILLPPQQVNSRYYLPYSWYSR